MTRCWHLLLLLIIAGCDPCGNLECVTDEQLELEIKDKVTGKDLLTGSSKRYDTSVIRFYSLKGADTVKLYYGFYKNPSFSTPDSTGRFYVYTNDANPIYIRLNAMDTDTLRLNYEASRTKCCGIISSITAATHNGAKLTTKDSYHLAK